MIMNDDKLYNSILLAKKEFATNGYSFDNTKLYSTGMENGWFHLTTGIDNKDIDYIIDIYYDDNLDYIKINYSKGDTIINYDYNGLLNTFSMDIIKNNVLVKKLEKEQ